MLFSWDSLNLRSDSFLGYISSLHAARHLSDFSGLMFNEMFNGGKILHFYNTFAQCTL